MSVGGIRLSVCLFVCLSACPTAGRLDLAAGGGGGRFAAKQFGLMSLFLMLLSKRFPSVSFTCLSIHCPRFRLPSRIIRPEHRECRLESGCVVVNFSADPEHYNRRKPVGRSFGGAVIKSFYDSC